MRGRYSVPIGQYVLPFVLAVLSAATGGTAAALLWTSGDTRVGAALVVVSAVCMTMTVAILMQCLARYSGRGWWSA